MYQNPLCSPCIIHHHHHKWNLSRFEESSDKSVREGRMLDSSLVQIFVRKQRENNTTSSN
jgi:hypothetical protein